MAKRDEELEKGIPLGTKVTVALGVLALLFVLYMVFFGSDERRQLDSPEAVLRTYTDFLTGYADPASPLPDTTIVQTWLSFFDEPSRRFFEENAEDLAWLALRVEPQTYEALSANGRRSHAMKFVLRYPPLGGVATIDGQRNLEGGGAEILVTSRTGQQATIPMVPGGGTWYIQDFMGVRARIEQDLESVDRGETGG